MASRSLGVGYWYWDAAAEPWRTMVFTTLAFSQMAHVMAIRSSSDSLFSIGVLSNRRLAAAVAGTLVLQLVIVYVPMFNRVFGTLPLSMADLGLAVVLASVVFAVVEMEKWLRRRRPALLISEALSTPAQDEQEIAAASGSRTLRH